MRNFFRLSLVCGLLSLAGCAAAPTGPKFSEIVLPQPPQDKAMIVVFREYAEPTALGGKVDVDATQIFDIPQLGFAHAPVDPGRHALALRWPGGTPGWQGNAEWESGKTYYYQLRGSSGMGWHFRSGLDLVDAGLAQATMKNCCRLITPQKQNVVLAANQSNTHSSTRAITFANVRQDMLADEVIAVIGSPDHVSSDSTGKKGIPFYFGTDTRRVSWSYTGAGFVVFTRNEYTGVLRVVETKEDIKAP